MTGAAIGIVLGFAVGLYLLFLIGNYLRKKAKGIPTGECSSCHGRKERLIQQYRRKYGPKKAESQD